MLIPAIKSDWQLLFRPERHGNYINDHCVIKANDGSWNLFGITSLESRSDSERYFVHAAGKSLTEPMTELEKVIDTGTRAWAPCVVEHEGLYYMYFGPGETKMEVTNVLSHWMGHKINIKGNPVMAVNRDHMVIKNNGKWIMYASGLKDSYSCISVLESDNLIDWDFKGYALTSSGSAPMNPPWGAFESPFVVKKDGLFYLFTTYTDCSHASYHNTIVFCSENPYNFGDYTAEKHSQMVMAELHSHAGEILEDNGKYYITSCGWRGYNSIIEGGVAIAELDWTEKQ